MRSGPTPASSGTLYHRRRAGGPGARRTPGRRSLAIPSRSQPFPSHDQKPFKFLFVGGTIHRKGIDLLLEAYATTFTADDPVCLVIKDMGGRSFYRGQTAGERIGEIRQQPARPGDRIHRPRPRPRRAGRALHRLRLPRAPLSRRGFRPADRRGDGLRLARHRHRAWRSPGLLQRGECLTSSPRGSCTFATNGSATWRPSTIPTGRTRPGGPAEPAAYRRRPSGRCPGEEAGGRRVCPRHLTWDRCGRCRSRLDSSSSGSGPSSLDLGAGHGGAGRPRSRSRSRHWHLRARDHRPRVSLCMIVKNEEAHLATCLESVGRPGGRDRRGRYRLDRCHGRRGRSLRCPGLLLPVGGQLRRGRNESLRHARGGLDLLARCRRACSTRRTAGSCRAAGGGLKDENAAYVMGQRSPAAPGSKAAVVADQVRLFRRLPEARWSYRVHEQILPALRRTGVDLRRSDVVIHHAGHEDADLRRRKLDRDLRLLLMENEERPDDPFTLFNLGSLYHETDRPAEALPLLQRSLERSRPRDSIVPKAACPDRRLPAEVAAAAGGPRRMPSRAATSCRQCGAALPRSAPPARAGRSRPGRRRRCCGCSRGVGARARQRG